MGVPVMTDKGKRLSRQRTEMSPMKTGFTRVFGADQEL
jgi:hypothetical protein